MYVLATLHQRKGTPLHVDWEAVGLRIGLDIVHSMRLCHSFKPC